MYLKKVITTYKGKPREYAQIVKSVRREDGKCSIEVVKSLGRMNTAEDWERARKIKEALENEEDVVMLKDVDITEQYELGLSWAAEGLWDRYRIGTAIQKALEKRKPQFNPEQITFMLAVTRLYEPGSDLSSYRWIKNRAWPRITVKPQWMYRTLDLLAEEKLSIEDTLFKTLKKQLNLDLTLVFYDLTSTYFEGEGPDLAEYGYSRDHRKDRKQLVLGVVLADSVPIAHRVWPGNTHDSATLEETVRDLKERFGIGEVIFVADRGVFKENMGDLDHYISSVRRRRFGLSEKLLREDVPGSQDKRAIEVHAEEGKRYILCLDEQRREQDLEGLADTVKECTLFLTDLKERFAYTGQGRPLTEEGAWKQIHKTLGRSRRLFQIDLHAQERTLTWKVDQKALEYEQAIAGKFLLVTTTGLEPEVVMKEYKNLQQVERCFNDLKNCLKLRPVYHWTDNRTRGHVFVCVLSLLLEKLMEKHTRRTFREIKETLEPVRVNRIEVYGKVIYKRNSISPAGKEVLSDLGVEPPSRVLIV
ncbi:MAG: IS1634 family transposase [Theionarchaea archaeon]|nr:IS1634 family transposase [Theionarchaea archaeon]